MRCRFLLSCVHPTEPCPSLHPEICIASSALSYPHDLHYSQELMEDPVMAADGFTYERAAIGDWLARGHASSPMTGAPLESTALVPNLAVRSAAAVAKRRRG